MLIIYNSFMCCAYFNHSTNCPVGSKINGGRFCLYLHLLSLATLANPRSSLLSSLWSSSSFLRISHVEVKLKSFLTFSTIWSNMNRLNETRMEDQHCVRISYWNTIFVALSDFSSGYDNLLSKHNPGNTRSKEGDELHSTWRETHHSPLGERGPNH